MPGDNSTREVEQAAQALIWGYPGLVFAALASAWTWGWSLLLVLNAHGNVPHGAAGFYVGMAGLGPTLAGLSCVLLAEGEAGVQRIVRQCFQSHSPFAWLLVVLAAAPAAAAALALEEASSSGGGGRLAASWMLAALAKGPAAGATRAWVLRAFTAGLGVAMGHVGGWHGFLTTHLLRSYSPVRGALVLGWLAAAWQFVPSFAMHWLSWGGMSSGGRGGSEGSPDPVTIAAALAAFEALAWVPSMALLTALYLGTRGSLLVCAAWHAVVAGVGMVASAEGARTGRASPVVAAALTLLATNILAVPAWVWLWREGFRRRRERRDEERGGPATGKLE